MKRLALIAALSAGAAPVMAQPALFPPQSWTSFQSGNQTNHTGFDQNGGTWTGTTVPMGSQTNSTFYGPNGQMTRCTSVPMGSQINTTCY
jgi:hypothetical protein